MANLTQTQIDDSDALVNFLRIHGSMTAREIYAVIGKHTAKVLGFAVQTGRVVKDGDKFRLPERKISVYDGETRKAYTIVTTSPDYDWSNC